jgi:hypothetical protein
MKINLGLILSATCWLVLEHFIGFELTVVGLLVIIVYHIENEN